MSHFQNFFSHCEEKYEKNCRKYRLDPFEVFKWQSQVGALKAVEGRRCPQVVDTRQGSTEGARRSQMPARVCLHPRRGEA